MTPPHPSDIHQKALPIPPQSTQLQAEKLRDSKVYLFPVVSPGDGRDRTEASGPRGEDGVVQMRERTKGYNTNEIKPL